MKTSTGQWQEVEITLKAQGEISNAYTDVDAWIAFTHSSGKILKRPAFWDGGNTWRVRFVSPEPVGDWSWTSHANVEDPGLAGQKGVITCCTGTTPSGRFQEHGLLAMSPGMRNLVHADGHPFLMVADTAWAMPFRATVEDCRVYAEDRQRKGFNSVLLMTVQPDMRATGPRERGVYEGFEVGFEDLADGHLNEIVPAYFQYLDQLVEVLIDHGIVPVYQPVFNGFGWKGKQTAGNRLVPEEYARYCRYLVARYGARPAIWLIGADGDGTAPAIPVAGAAVEEWDAYAQPTGLHYAPHGNNRMHQDAAWLDFQWCQTGHSGEHRQDKVADMWRNLPVKGVANGEPTYEHMGNWDKAVGWWQGHEAWMNLLSGGTMGVVYGAGGLWQWQVDKDEPGFDSWTVAEGCGWRDTLDFQGATYVGILGKILKDVPLTDMEKRDDYSYGNFIAAVPGKLILVYLGKGGGCSVLPPDRPGHYTAYDPRTGAVIDSGKVGDGVPHFNYPFGEPVVVILAD